MWIVVASAEQWLCVLLTAVSGAAGAGGGQTGNCISHPRPETSPGHQISPPVDPARHYATPSPLQLTCQRDFAKFHIAYRSPLLLLGPSPHSKCLLLQLG